MIKDYESVEIFQMQKPYVVLLNEGYHSFSDEEEFRKKYPDQEVKELSSIYVLDLRT